MTITRITQANSERIEIDERRYRRVAVIDLGSNSARLIIMRTLPDRFYYLEDEIREVVRLRSGMTEAGLSKEAMARGVATLRMFNRFCESLAVDELIATTTSAVREAANRDEFLAKVASKVGLRLRVLSGEEEAYYGAIGAQNALPLNEGVVLDIGGGSAQLSLIKAGRWQTGQALTLGALALSERFVESDPPTRSEVRRIRKEVRRQLHEIPWLNEASPTVIGLGGTLRNLARVTIRHRKLPLGTVNGYLLRDDEIKYLVKRFRKLPLNRRQRLAGLSSDRADIIMAGAIVAQEVLRWLGANGMRVATYGLREGLFFEEFWAALDYPVPDDLRESHVRNVALRYNYHATHAAHVQRLALRLFDDLAALHGADARERQWLAAAATLHDIGNAINYEDHHKHSQALILGNGLPAFGPEEVAMIALMSRYHRRGRPKLHGFDPLFDNPAVAVQRLRQLAGMLRVAEFLERSRAGLVTDLRVEWDESDITIQLIGEERPVVEMWDAGRKGVDLMEEAFGRTVHLRYDGEAWA